MKKENSFRQNGFDFLKYWAAFSVMFLHYTYFAFTEAEQAWGFMDKLRKISEFFPGVIVLFAVSGFWISDSMERARSRKEFLKKRVLRIYPQLWFCTVVNFIVLMVLAGEKLDRSIFIWLGTQILGIANTPSCLKNFATGSVNGALWTIFVEVQLYLLLCWGYSSLKKIRWYHWGVLLFIFSGLNIFCDYAAKEFGNLAAKLIERSFVPYAIWFLIGAFCYRYKENMIVYLKCFTLPLFVLYIFVSSYRAEQPGYYAGIGISVLCPFLVIGLGYLLPAVRVKLDLSYGMFLYHWIVLNILIHFELLSRWKWYISFLIFIFGTLVLARISQYLEGKMLFLWKRNRVKISC